MVEVFQPVFRNPFRSLMMQQSGGGGPAYTLRQQIEGLRAGGITPCGARAGIYKVPGVDASPTGFVYNAGAGSVTIGGTFSGNLSFWDFTGLSLINQGTIGMITDCKFGEPLRAPSGRLYYIDNYAAGSIDLIEYCTFEGPYTFGGSGTAINCRATGTGVFYAPGNIREIRYNRFLGLTSDTLKIAGSQSVGGQIIKRNYFGPPVNLPNIPADYNSGTSYATGVAVKKAANGYVYISLSAANVGNPLPTGASKTDATAFWQGVDPHADFITTVAAVGNGITISENCMDHTSQPPGYVSPVASMGLTNALRVSRNSGTDYILNRITMANNVVFRNPSEGNSAPIQVADGSQPNFNGPIEFIGNWLAAGGGTPYFHPSSNGWVDVWSNNRDYATDALIVGPTLRVTAINPVIGILAQSQTARILNSGSFYRQIAQPSGAGVAGNVTTYLDDDGGAGPVKYEVTAAEVAAGHVNPTVAAWGVFWNHVLPGRHFNIVDLAVAGTGRLSIAQDAHADNRWPGFSAMLARLRLDYSDFDAIIECWQGNDAATAKNFLAEWAPFYTGQRAGGGAFTVGTANPDSTSNTGEVLNHILWDMEADPAAYGRGVFKRNRTKLYFTGWPTFSGAPDTPAEMRNSSTNADGSARSSYPSQLDMLARSKLDDFLAAYPSFAGAHIGMTHAANMEGGTHASVTDPEGQILIGWGIAVAALKVAGMAVGQPVITSVETAADGSYADVLVSLPNGGDLTTFEALRSLSPAAIEPPHYQPVMGFEIRRAADAENARRPVYKTSETSYPVNYRGTVVVQSAGSGVGVARVGRIRITPTTPFANGDMIYFGRGDASMLMQLPRDVDAKLYRRQPLENIASFYDAAATYPCPGIWVKPQPPVLTVSGVAGADLTAPVLSGVSASKTDTTAALAWSTDEANGTAYWLVDTNATRTAAQIIAGGTFAGSRAVTAIGAQTAFGATGLTASTAYYFHLVHVDAASNASTVSNTSFTTDAAAAPFFTVVGTGPYFVDPATVPASTTRIEHEIKFRIPSSVTLSTTNLITQKSIGFDIRLAASNGGQVDLLKIEDGLGASVLGVTAMATTLPRDTWLTLIVDANQTTQQFIWSLTGYAGATVAFSPTGNGVFQTGREISYLASTAGNVPIPSGIQVEYVESYFTTGGTRTLRKRIAGNAATVNADGWKLGGNAT